MRGDWFTFSGLIGMLAYSGKMKVVKKNTEATLCESEQWWHDCRREDFSSIDLHQAVTNVWKVWVRLVLKKFVYTQNSCSCSAHLPGGSGPKKP